jgi:hypothetical protein
MSKKIKKKGVLIPIDWGQKVKCSHHMFGVFIHYLLKYANDGKVQTDNLEKSLKLETLKCIDAFKAQGAVNRLLELYWDLTNNHWKVVDFDEAFELDGQIFEDEVLDVVKKTKKGRQKYE